MTIFSFFVQAIIMNMSDSQIRFLAIDIAGRLIIIDLLLLLT